MSEDRLVEESCRKGTRGSECQPWTLVLPPWCWLPRWYGFEGGAGTRWSELFNLEALKSAGVPFQEYTGSAVDLGVVPVAGRKVQHLKDGWGDFFGFTKEMKAQMGLISRTCAGGALSPPDVWSLEQVFFGGSSLSSASKAYQSMVKTDLEARLRSKTRRS
eukprot:g30990.t1